MRACILCLLPHQRVHDPLAPVTSIPPLISFLRLSDLVSNAARSCSARPSDLKNSNDIRSTKPVWRIGIWIPSDQHLWLQAHRRLPSFDANGDTEALNLPSPIVNTISNHHSNAKQSVMNALR